MHGDRTPPPTPPLLPPGRDELETRLLALREVTSTIPLATPTRVRARGEARRRHQATAVVTGCALAAAAVVFAIGGLPGRPQADAPPATQAPSPSAAPSPSGTPSASSGPTPTTPTSSSTSTTTSTTSVTSAAGPAVTRPAGDTSLIVPPGEIDGVYFLGGNVWSDLGLGQGHKIAWHEAFDWEGGVSVYSACDAEADAETGESDLTNVGILNLAGKQSLGRQRVRLLDDAAAGRTYLKRARTRLEECPAVTRRATDGYAKLTVTEQPESGPPDGNLPMVVYRTVTEFADDSDPFVEWIVMGYTQTRSGRTVVTVLSTGQDVDGEVMWGLGRAALKRIDSVS